MKLLALPALKDNYFWLWHNGVEALVVDPGEAAPVLRATERLGLTLKHIVVTHHHQDHVGGIKELVSQTQAQVHGPDHPQVPQPDQVLRGGERISVLGQTLDVLAVPGHTLTHLAYYAPATPGLEHPVLFCGDTLFSAGCGRLFEGTPQDMLSSLKKLAALPGDTRVCCAHEYTLSNLKFARHVEPHNPWTQHHQAQCEETRQRGEPTLPSCLAVELQVNPFLRTHSSEILSTLKAHQPTLDLTQEVEVFAALRQWKDHF
jgi:hydroxyacylglutathione hydrolase